MAEPHAPAPRTLFEKVWDAHVVKPETPDTPAAIPGRSLPIAVSIA